MPLAASISDATIWSVTFDNASSGYEAKLASSITHL
jgi:hypothetical protein